MSHSKQKRRGSVDDLGEIAHPTLNENGSPMSAPDRQQPSGEDLSSMYARRFSSRLAYRDQVWRTLNRRFFSQWIHPGDTVLDLGCGYGEFVNNIVAKRRIAMDLNPDARERVAIGADVIVQDCSQPWPIDEQSLDAVFSSNFFEHLPTKDHLRTTLEHAHSALRPGGRLVAMGPNVRVVPGAYWDFFDHHLPLTERSLAEALQEAGFEIERCVARFLPYTMSDGPNYPAWMLDLYLRVPFLWRIAGKQFLLVATRPVEL